MFGKISGTRTISTKLLRELSSSFFSCKSNRNLACFLSVRAKDLSAPPYETHGNVGMIRTSENIGILKMYFSSGSFYTGCMNPRTDSGQKKSKIWVK